MPNQWSSVLGKSGDKAPLSLGCLENIAEVGMTFGAQDQFGTELC